MEKGVKSLQIFGDSQVIINWINGNNIIHNIQLVPLLDEVCRLKEQLDHVDMKHVYREINILADELANAGVQIQEGTWFIAENYNSYSSGSL